MGGENAGKYRHFMIVLACVQNLLFAGLIFGWAAISSTLLVTPLSRGGAGLDRDFVRDIFVVASSINFLAPLSLGVVLDFAGPKVCSTLSHLLVGTGCLLFGMTDKASGFMIGRCHRLYRARATGFAPTD